MYSWLSIVLRISSVEIGKKQKTLQRDSCVARLASSVSRPGLETPPCLNTRIRDLPFLAPEPWRIGVRVERQRPGSRSHSHPDKTLACFVVFPSVVPVGVRLGLFELASLQSSDAGSPRGKAPYSCPSNTRIRRRSDWPFIQRSYR